MKIRKGDRVQVLSGKDRGKTGTVTRWCQHCQEASEAR
jgi:ribosomal protein L24